ncbi:MAG: pyruvate ferredoxin oxidoreductase [Chloroflexi bacterium]|nr:pyruvate ferredoxin oxidoreductase [Chloroflexota bacterium]
MALATAKRPPTQPATGRAVALNGAMLVAHAMRQVHPDVVACYPITPQTIITETFSEFVANGEVQTEFVAVESEHAALSVCIGAAAAGARAQTATSGPGLALMWELLYVASGCRLPIVLHLCTRAFNAPLNILCDHSDAMGAREASWPILFGEDGQEAYDNAIQAVRIAEHLDVLLPVMSTQDGFTITHGIERAEVLPDEAVREFVGEYHPNRPLLDVAHPMTYGPWDYHDFYFEHKRQQADAMEKALGVIEAVGQEFGRLSGRSYGLVQPYRLEDADLVVVVLGSAAGTLRTVVDEQRSHGVKAGLLKVRAFRPFPIKAVAQALARAKAVAVLDRSMAYGAPACALFQDVCVSLALHGGGPRLVNYVYGLGGRDTLPDQFRRVFDDLKQIAAGASAQPVVRYLGLRDGQ